MKLFDSDHLLLVTMHHIVSDGASVRVLMSELEIALHLVFAERTFELPENSLGFADYAQWQRARAADEARDAGSPTGQKRSPE